MWFFLFFSMRIDRIVLQNFCASITSAMYALHRVILDKDIAYPEAYMFLTCFFKQSFFGAIKKITKVFK